MTSSVPDVLAKIVDEKLAEIAGLVPRRAELEQRAYAMRESHRDFRAAITATRPAIIAESKKASPSKGLLSASYDAARNALAYERGGAAAVSVLTDERFFQGSLADLKAARAAVGIPVLRKDFTLDEIQVYEAAAHGADAILLIAAILDTRRLRQLRDLAAALGLAALVEVHDEAELLRAIDSGADIIGVNNRDLRDFRVTLETSLSLAPRMPARTVRVSESGIHSAADLRLLLGAGYNAFLVGEHLMKAGDPQQALEALMLR